MVQYDRDLICNPSIQIKIIMSELKMLKNKTSSLKDCLTAHREEVPKIFTYLQKGYCVQFNIKLEQVIGLLINISVVLLQEFAKDPSGIGIPDISHVTEDISEISDETHAFGEDLDVFVLVMKYFHVSSDVYIILSSDDERDLPGVEQV